VDCPQVRESLWCGSMTPFVLEHLAGCEACRQELERVKRLNNATRHINHPLPTRSLLPPREEIEKAVRQNKRNRFSKWMTSCTIAAAILLALTKTDNLPQAPTANSGDAKESKREIHALQADVPFDFVLYRKPNFQIAVPSAWTIHSTGDGTVTFRHEGQTVGGVKPTKTRQGEKDPLQAVQLPADTEVVQAGLEAYRTENAVKYLLRRTDYAQLPLEVHTFFLRGTIAYDIWLLNDPALVPPHTATGITASFQTP
jgi:hypothetical protein